MLWKVAPNVTVRSKIIASVYMFKKATVRTKSIANVYIYILESGTKKHRKDREMRWRVTHITARLTADTYRNVSNKRPFRSNAPEIFINLINAAPLLSLFCTGVGVNLPPLVIFLE